MSSMLRSHMKTLGRREGPHFVFKITFGSCFVWLEYSPRPQHYSNDENCARMWSGRGRQTHLLMQPTAATALWSLVMVNMLAIQDTPRPSAEIWKRKVATTRMSSGKSCKCRQLELIGCLFSLANKHLLPELILRAEKGTRSWQHR